MDRERQIELYLREAREMLSVAQATLQQQFFSTAVNRAYYAVFYAANAALASLGLARKKHTAVLAEFRKHFIKTGILGEFLSDFYGQLMDDRHAADYDLLFDLSEEEAIQNVKQARIFVEEIETWLKH